MKKVFFTLAVLCTVAMMAGCKGGAANESTTPNEITWTSIENKLANYQRNMQSGQLTAQQAQYAEQSLQQESAQLQNDYSVALESLEARYTAALNQIADSLKAAVVRANARHNASFVISYGAGGQVIVADPTKDITQEVLDDLNKPFKKKKK